MKYTGVTARGIKLPIIKQGDDLVKIIANCIMDAAADENIQFKNKDVVCVTESLLARAQGNFVNIKDVAKEISEKFNDADCIGFVHPITSRNRVSHVIKSLALTGKKIVIQLAYPKDEMYNEIISLDEIEAKGINPYSDVITEKQFRELFGYPVHKATGVDYITYYRQLAGNGSEIILANNPRAILNYTKYVIPADVHTRERTKRILLENGAKKVIGLRELINKSVNGSGFNPEFGLLGANLSTEDTIKLFPRDCNKFVLALQKELQKRTGKILEVMLYGDGCFKPVDGNWELYDPVVSPGFTSGLFGKPSEIKLKYMADNLTKGQTAEESRKTIETLIKNKEKDMVGKPKSLGTTPARFTDLIGSLADLLSGSGDRGTPVILVQNYFSNYCDED